MRSSELVLLAYFGYLTVASLFTRLDRRYRLAVSAAALTICGITVAVSRTAVRFPPLRDLYPAACIPLAYWLPRALFPGVNARQEAWLLRTDARILGWTPVTRAVAGAGRASREWLELSYLSVYAMIPAGAGVAWWSGGSPAVDRYWTIVLIATLSTYGTLPWIATRTPRAIERLAPRLPVQAAAHRVMSVVSHELNTFPSGHASASLAAALALLGTSLPVAAVFGLLAIAIAVASVLGRYHFAVDVLAGAALAVLAWAALR